MIGMMGCRIPEQGWRKGPWTNAEDKLLIEYVTMHGEGRWSSVASCTGLNRSGKSCRLRWVNYLRPGLKKGRFTPQEEGIIIELHALWGNKWSTIARYLPGRTDNEIKNYWRTHFKNKARPSQNQEIKQKRNALKLNQHQQDKQMMDNGILVPHADANIKDIAAEPQGKQEPLFLSTCPVTSNTEQQNQSDIAASWWDSLTEDGLWSGFLWNLDIDHLCVDHNTAGASFTDQVHTND